MRAFIAIFCLVTISWTSFASDYSEVVDNQSVLAKRIVHFNLMNETKCLLDVKLLRDLVLKPNEKYVHIQSGVVSIRTDLRSDRDQDSTALVSCVMSFRNNESVNRSESLKSRKVYSKESLLIVDEILDVSGATRIENRLGFPYSILLRGEEAGLALRCTHTQGKAVTLKDLKEALTPFAKVSMYCPGL